MVEFSGRLRLRARGRARRIATSGLADGFEAKIVVNTSTLGAGFPVSVLQPTAPQRHPLRGRSRSVRMIVTRQRASTRTPVIGNEGGAVLAYNIQIEVYEPLSGDIRRSGAHSVRRMAD